MSPELVHDAVQELLGAYALDAVSAEERRAVEAHLLECPRCRAEVAEHLETAAMLAGSGAAPDGVWDRIASSLGDAPVVLDLERAGRRRDPWRWITSAVAAVAVAAALSLGVAVRETQQRVDRITAGLQQDGLEAAAMAAVFDPDATSITLTSSDGSVRVDAVVLPRGTGYLVRDDLPALPAGRTYQLWALGGANPISAGVLGDDPGIVAFRVDPGLRGLAITRERAGGSVSPSLPPLAAGEVQTA